MYEVSQNVDLSLKVDAISKKFDQLLALNTLPTNSPNVEETQIGQLAFVISRRNEGKLPSHPIENPRANYNEQAKTTCINIASSTKLCCSFLCLFPTLDILYHIVNNV
ncbi:hypothetical protein M9H77_07457 [Catharanthus roseus]|uniref:Uncharacterized protein n=1 Tax=Catharanthus roseus TaxID=4058 RepID=A0ACC0BUZ5_CATRO|nr:hypothetical protein M9H77_07457 [Catharanthus roseus]